MSETEANKIGLIIIIDRVEPKRFVGDEVQVLFAAFLLLWNIPSDQKKKQSRLLT